jgi:hypothetical protein
MTKVKRKKVKLFVTALPNIVPAGTAITRSGQGPSVPIAIGRALAEIFEDEKLRRKKIILPMKLVVTNGE